MGLTQAALAADEISWTKEQDGIKADLRASSGVAMARWRFLRPLSESNRVAGYELSLDGNPIEPGRLMQFPMPGETSNLVMLVDRTGGAARIEQMRQGIAAAILVADRNPGFMSVIYAPYDRVPAPISGDDQPTQLASIDPSDAPPDLNASLLISIDVLMRTQGQRRNIFVFGDGFSEPPLDVAKLSAAASEANVGITFIRRGGTNRNVDHAALSRIAAASGGEVVDESGLVDFFRAPFRFANNGAAVIYSLADVTRYFWQKSPELKFAIQYGAKRLELQTAYDAPIAGPVKTTQYLYDNHKMTVAGVGFSVLALMIGGVGFVAGQRRRKTLDQQIDAAKTKADVLDSPYGEPPADLQSQASPDTPPPPPMLDVSDQSEPAPGAPKPAPLSRSEPDNQGPLAVLDDLNNGASYPIFAPVANIGRLTTNEVVLNDPAVSRLHAVLEQQPFGKFTIANRSQNGTFINNELVENATLSDGDLITIGTTVLRYTSSPAQG